MLILDPPGMRFAEMEQSVGSAYSNRNEHRPTRHLPVVWKSRGAGWPTLRINRALLRIRSCTGWTPPCLLTLGVNGQAKASHNLDARCPSIRSRSRRRRHCRARLPSRGTAYRTPPACTSAGQPLFHPPWRLTMCPCRPSLKCHHR